MYLLLAPTLVMFILSLLDLFDPRTNEPNLFADFIYSSIVVISMMGFIFLTKHPMLFRLINLLIWTFYEIFAVTAYFDWQLQSIGDFESFFGIIGILSILLTIVSSLFLGALEFLKSRFFGLVIVLGAGLSSVAFVFHPIANYNLGCWIFSLSFLTYYQLKLARFTISKRPEKPELRV
jgi:hypothetical protein